MARGHRLAPHLVGLRQHLLQPRGALAHCLRGAAGVLDRHCLQQRPAIQPLGLHQPADLVRLAAEPEDEDAGEIRVLRIAGDGPPQHVHRLALARHAAAGAVGQRDDAIDIGEVAERAGAELLGDIARRGRRAVDRAQDAEIVARRHLAVRPHDAFEGRALFFRHVVGRLIVGGEGVVAGEIAHRDIVRVDVLARRDRRGGEADDLVVLAHRRADLDRRCRHLVPGRDMRPRLDALAGNRRAGQDIGACHHDVVGRVEADGERWHGAESPGEEGRGCGVPALYIRQAGDSIWVGVDGTIEKHHCEAGTDPAIAFHEVSGA